MRRIEGRRELEADRCVEMPGNRQSKTRVWIARKVECRFRCEVNVHADCLITEPDLYSSRFDLLDRLAGLLADPLQEQHGGGRQVFFAHAEDDRGRAGVPENRKRRAVGDPDPPHCRHITARRRIKAVAHNKAV